MGEDVGNLILHFWQSRTKGDEIKGKRGNSEHWYRRQSLSNPKETRYLTYLCLKDTVTVKVLKKGRVNTVCREKQMQNFIAMRACD